MRNILEKLKIFFPQRLVHNGRARESGYKRDSWVMSRGVWAPVLMTVFRGTFERARHAFEFFE